MDGVGVRVAIVSALIGPHDKPKRHVVQDVDVEWLQVTEPAAHLSKRMASKVPKFRPDLFVDADVYVWIDASIRVVSPHFAAWCVDQVGDGLVAHIRHPWRTSIIDEADAALESQPAKYAAFDLRGQAAHYVKEGHPHDWGLWENGFGIYRNHPDVHRWGDRMLVELLRWGPHCQIAEPHVLRTTIGYPVDVDAVMRGNPYFVLIAHDRED
jgi:hypothetical protein